VGRWMPALVHDRALVTRCGRFAAFWSFALAPLTLERLKLASQTCIRGDAGALPLICHPCVCSGVFRRGEIQLRCETNAWSHSDSWPNAIQRTGIENFPQTSYLTQQSKRGFAVFSGQYWLLEMARETGGRFSGRAPPGKAKTLGSGGGGPAQEDVLFEDGEPRSARINARS